MLRSALKAEVGLRLYVAVIEAVDTKGSSLRLLRFCLVY